MLQAERLACRLVPFRPFGLVGQFLLAHQLNLAVHFGHLFLFVAFPVLAYVIKFLRESVLPAEGLAHGKLQRLSYVFSRGVNVAYVMHVHAALLAVHGVDYAAIVGVEVAQVAHGAHVLYAVHAGVAEIEIAQRGKILAFPYVYAEVAPLICEA